MAIPQVLPQILGLQKCPNFDMCVMLLGFKAILGDPKFRAIHFGLSHCIALTAYT